MTTTLLMGLGTGAEYKTYAVTRMNQVSHGLPHVTSQVRNISLFGFPADPSTECSRRIRVAVFLSLNYVK